MIMTCEMTLKQWCETLPDSHRANKDLKELEARIDELESTLRSHKVRIGLLEGMIDEGLGWGDIKNDISPIPDMNS